MSYEGYIQCICPQGHLNVVSDVYNWESDRALCPTCKEEIRYFNAVDDTNCDDYGWIDFSAFKIKDEVRQTCNLGCEHVIEPAIYKIPCCAEEKEARTVLQDGARVRISSLYANKEVGSFS